MLLNCALLTRIRGLPLKAEDRISPPMCSPSRSQSVQMKSAWLYLACCSMFLAICFLSYADGQRHSWAVLSLVQTYISD